MEVKLAFRDEKINIFAMTYGGVPALYSHQFILCKKAPLPKDRVGPFLLDIKKSEPNFDLSKIGINYNQRMLSRNYKLNYIAFIDRYLKIKINISLFNKLYSEGYFSIWDPRAPLDYYEGSQEGYLVLFRVYEIENVISDSLLEKGRRGRNFYYNLSHGISVSVLNPVIENSNYEDMRTKLINLLDSNDWLLDSITTKYDNPKRPVLDRYTINELTENERKAYNHSKDLSQDELLEKIRNKIPRKRQIIIESKGFYRDPDVSSFAQRRASGICDCCGEAAPFLRDDNTPYLESHHLIPLGDGGEDSIDNVCAVCPNCHKMLHYGQDRFNLTDEIILRFKYK